MAVSDDNRAVELDEDFSVLPDQTSDDTDRGWGEAAPTTRVRGRDGAALSARDLDLLAERPPHWG